MEVFLLFLNARVKTNRGVKWLGIPPLTYRCRGAGRGICTSGVSSFPRNSSNSQRPAVLWLQG